MDTKGYKAFNIDMTNRYGKVFEEGKIYTTDSIPKYGTRGQGFHFCKRLEDTLRFFPAMEEEIKIAQVTGLGDLDKNDDNYYEYFDMYCTNKIRIDHILSRTEIIQMFLRMPTPNVIRFIQGFRLSQEEISLFRMTFEDEGIVQKAISYYQEGDKEAFSVDRQKQKLKSILK